jgi:hypothetical protein
MPSKQAARQKEEEVEGKRRPVRVDLLPAVHKALRKEAAELETSMAMLARTIISEKLGFKDQGSK